MVVDVADDHLRDLAVRGRELGLPDLFQQFLLK